MIGGLEIRLYDARMKGVSCNALGRQVVVQGAGVDDGGEFGVAVAFPGAG